MSLFFSLSQIFCRAINGNLYYDLFFFFFFFILAGALFLNYVRIENSI